MRRPRLVLTAVLVSLLVAPAASSAVAPSEMTVREERVLELLNDIRQERGLEPLASDGRLVTIARRHSREMLRYDFFSHRGRDGSTPDRRIRKAGGRGATGETIAWGSGSYAAPAEIVRTWMDSPPHRRILLDGDFRRIGIGRALGTFQGYGGAALFTADLSARAG
jgi:uncharacterized protein YkwD